MPGDASRRRCAIGLSTGRGWRTDAGPSKQAVGRNSSPEHALGATPTTAEFVGQGDWALAGKIYERGNQPGRCGQIAVTPKDDEGAGFGAFRWLRIFLSLTRRPFAWMISGGGRACRRGVEIGCLRLIVAAEKPSAHGGTEKIFSAKVCFCAGSKARNRPPSATRRPPPRSMRR